MSAILFSSVIGPVPVAVVLKEGHETKLGITEQPIETGAKITDHAYIEPKRLTLEFADANAAGTFATLTQFQESRVPFTAVSGLFVYNDMLIERLSAERDATYSRILYGKAELREVIIVETAYTSSESEGQSSTTGKSKQGKAGGKKSTTSARPKSSTTSGAATKDRAASTNMRGDASTSTPAPTVRKSLAASMRDSWAGTP